MKNFHQEQWQFFKKRGLSFFIRDNYHVEAHPKDITLGMYVVAIKNFEQFEKFLKTKTDVYISNQAELNLAFFLDYYKKSEDKNSLLTTYESMCDTSISQGYLKLCDHLCNNNEARIKFIKELPSSFLKTKHIKLHELENYLNKHGIDNSKQEHLIFDLLKERKIQLKDPTVYANIKPFLKSKFSEEQLKNYFSFFPALRADFEDVNIDIFEQVNKVSTFTHFNLRNAVTRFGIDDWKAITYYDCVKELCEGLKNFYKLDNCHVGFTNQSKQIIGISFSHNNKNFNNEVLTKSILSYFNHLKLNSKNKESITSWLMQEKLNKELIEKTSIKQAIKI